MSFIWLLWFLTSHFISFWTVWNYFNINWNFNSSIIVKTNVIQTNKNTYVVKQMADEIWKKTKDISSLWIIANCSWDYSKIDIENNIENNSWTILSWFDNWNSVVTWTDCSYYNIANPSFNKDLTWDALTWFSNSKIDINWNFSWTDIKDMTTRGFLLTWNVISTNIKNPDKMLIVSSEKYLYGWTWNIIQLLYQVWNNSNDILNQNDKFYYTSKFNKFVWLNSDWTFKTIKTKPIIYHRSSIYWKEINNKNNIANEVKYSLNASIPSHYQIITSYTWNNAWNYYINWNKKNTNNVSQNNDFNSEIYMISNKTIWTQSKESESTANLNLEALWNYIKNIWNVDKVYFKKDIINWKIYMAITKNNYNYYFIIKWGNWIYSINNCINQNNNLTWTLNSTINLSIWTLDWNTFNNINYKEANFDNTCYKTSLADIINTTKIDIDTNWNREITKDINNDKFYSDKDWNLNNYLTNNKDYLSRNYIFTTPWTLSNILFTLDKSLNKKPYVLYLYKSNNSIKDISYDPQKQISNYTLDWDSHYDSTKSNSNPNYYDVISNIENNTGNILQFKIQKDSNINYSITYNWFIKNVIDNNWLLTLQYDKNNIDNSASLKVEFKDNNWNVLNTYIVNIEKKQVVNNDITLNPWSIWYLYTDWKLYWNLTTKQKTNTFIINNIKNTNLYCKTLTTNITFSSKNIMDNFYIYNNKVNKNQTLTEQNNNTIDPNSIVWWLVQKDANTLTYKNVTHNINLKDYTDNINRFYIESSKTTANNYLTTTVNITCNDFSWKTYNLIKNKSYDLTVSKDSNRKLSAVFYNPIIKNWTILPLLAYWKNWDYSLIKNGNWKYKYNDLENRLSLTYYWKGIKHTDWNIPIQWSQNWFWATEWNSNKTFNDIWYKAYWKDKYWKENNKYQYTLNSTTATRGIVTNDISGDNSVLKYKTEPLTPPVCEYAVCWGKWPCSIIKVRWQKIKNYYENRNYNDNNYRWLLWGSLKTQNVDLSNMIKNNNIWKSYSNNNMVNFSALINVPVREVKYKDKNKLPLISPLFVIKSVSNNTGLIIKYADSKEISKRITETSFNSYKNKYLWKWVITLNSKLKWYVKNVWYRESTVWPCKTDFENWDYKNWNTKRCYVYYNKKWKSFYLTNTRYYPNSTNRYNRKDIFPTNNWKAILNQPWIKGIYNLQYVVDIMIQMYSLPYSKNKDGYNLSALNNSANVFLDNWWENLLNLDLPIQYAGQYTILWNTLNWKLNAKKINNFISFYNNISLPEYTTIDYWLNIFKQYFTKIIVWQQKSQVISTEYHYWPHCEKTDYNNYIENKQFVNTKIKSIKMNFWAWYYQGWYVSAKYPSYFNDFNDWDNYTNVNNMIDKNLDVGSTVYNQQVWLLWWKIKLFWVWYTKNPWRFSYNSQVWWQLTTIQNNNPNFITTSYENWNNQYKIDNLKNFISNWKYFNKIIYENDNDNLNKLLFDWEDYNWNKLATWNKITKIIVTYNNVNIKWFNWNNNLKWNISLISNNSINIMTNINKKQTSQKYYWIFYTKQWNTNIWNNVVYINWIYLITNNVNTYYSTNPLIIHWFVYNLWNWTFNCYRNITSVFLLQSSAPFYTDIQNLKYTEIWNTNFNSYWQFYLANKTSWCWIKSNYEMKANFLFKKIWNLWF